MQEMLNYIKKEKSEYDFFKNKSGTNTNAFPIFITNEIKHNTNGSAVSRKYVSDASTQQKTTRHRLRTIQAQLYGRRHCQIPPDLV